MSRKKWRGDAARRDGTSFVLLPRIVLESLAFRSLSHPARALLVDIAMQFSGRNNGQLVCCAKFYRPLGWRSADTVTRALRQLLEAGLLIETRKGRRPNVASWFALSWRELDVTEGLDIDSRQYRRGEYLRAKPAEKNARLAPSGGTGGCLIAPSGGVMESPATPAGGAIRAVLAPSPTPSGGEYLELPSPRCVERAPAGARVLQGG